MNVTGNARIFLNRNDRGWWMSAQVSTKDKETGEYARAYLPVIPCKEIREKISDYTPSRFDVCLKDAFLMASEYNGETELKLYVKSWGPAEDREESGPVKEPEKKTGKKTTKAPAKKNPKFEEVETEEELPF